MYCWYFVAPAAPFGAAVFDADGADLAGSPFAGEDMLTKDAMTLMQVSKHNAAMSVRDIF
jgi:hypothetical protein